MPLNKESKSYQYMEEKHDKNQFDVMFIYSS